MRKEKNLLLNQYIEELMTIKRELVVDNKKSFLTLEKYNISLNNGRVITREKILKGGLDGSAAIILPITEEGEYLMAVEPRVFTELTVDVGFPAGYIDKFEDEIEAARRELLEETGYDTNNIIKLGSFYQDQGCSGALNSYFLGLNVKKVSDQSLDEGEFIRFMTFNEEEVEELISLGYMSGLNSAYIFEKSKNYLKRR